MYNPVESSVTTGTASGLSTLDRWPFYRLTDSLEQDPALPTCVLTWYGQQDPSTHLTSTPAREGAPRRTKKEAATPRASCQAHHHIHFLPHRPARAPEVLTPGEPAPSCHCSCLSCPVPVESKFSSGSDQTLIFPPLSRAPLYCALTTLARHEQRNQTASTRRIISLHGPKSSPAKFPGLSVLPEGWAPTRVLGLIRSSGQPPPQIP